MIWWEFLFSLTKMPFLLDFFSDLGNQNIFLNKNVLFKFFGMESYSKDWKLDQS